MLRSFLFLVRASVANDDNRVRAVRLVNGDGEALRSSMVSSTSCNVFGGRWRGEGLGKDSR